MKIINLLPREEQDQLRLDSTNNVVRRFWMTVLLCVVVFLGLGFAAQQYLHIAISNVDSEIDADKKLLESSDIKELQDQVVTLNRSLAEIKSIRNQQYQWSEVVMEISRIMPVRAQLNSLMMDRDTGEVTILGRAENRDVVLEVWSNLKKSAMFSEVNFPLPNLDRPTDSNFTYTFTVNVDKIKHDKL
jgi:Tfp pilus assembly protein PilN